MEFGKFMADKRNKKRLNSEQADSYRIFNVDRREEELIK